MVDFHPFSANRDYHQFKKMKKKVLPIVLSVNVSSRIIISLLFSKFVQESTHWFMSYSKKMVSPSIAIKITFFLAYCEKS